MERECFYFDFKWKIVQQESLLKEKFRSKKPNLKGRMNGNDHNNKRFNLNQGTNRFKKVRKAQNHLNPSRNLNEMYSIHSKYWIFKI